MSNLENNNKNNPEDYELTLTEAAKALGKSKRTVHRYIEGGKLSKVYVSTDHGREIRLKREEILKLAVKLNEAKTDLDSEEPFASGDPLNLNIREVLSRYERTLYQLGEMAEKLSAKKEAFREKKMKLEEERDRLKVRLLNKNSQVETLQKELDRPLSFTERLFGRLNLDS